MRLLAVFPDRLNPKGIAELVRAALGDNWTVTGVGSPGEDREALASADALLVALVDVRAADLDAATNLRFIQTPSDGFDHIDTDAAARRSIPVCNVGTAGAEAGVVAE